MSCRKRGEGYKAFTPESARRQYPFAKRLPQVRSLMVFDGGKADMNDRHAEGGRVQRAMGY